MVDSHSQAVSGWKGIPWMIGRKIMHMYLNQENIDDGVVLRWLKEDESAKNSTDFK